MANFKTWEERFPVIEDRSGQKYWIQIVRKKLESRAKHLDPSQLNLFNSGYDPIE